MRRLVVIALLCMLFLSLSAAYIGDRLQAVAAANFLEELRSLDVVTAEPASIADFVRRHDGFVFGQAVLPDVEELCRDRCTVSFEYSNRYLARLRLAPPTHLVGGIMFVNGKLIKRGAALYSGTFEVSAEQSAEPSIDELQIAVRESGGEPWKVFILVGANARPTIVEAAFSLNAQCISQLKGCQEIQKLQPNIGLLSAWDGDK